MDEYEILNDEFLNGGKWSMIPYTKSSYFSRSSRSTFELTAELQENKPLTKEEIEIIHPYLPIRFGRINDISWGDTSFQSIESIKGLFFRFELENYLDEIYETSNMYLSAIGKNGRSKTSVLIEASNKKHFTCAEILYKANIIQTKANPDQSRGIGIYRLGLKKKLPVFYIGEYYDLAKIIGSW